MIAKSHVTEASTRHIQDLLKGIAATESVRIVMAIESGSRAWGFPSADSDHDIRMVYIRPAIDYLSIFPRRDVIETPIVHDEVLRVEQDINGWDIKKAFHLACGSNFALLEWLHSPIVYASDTQLYNVLRDFTDDSADLDRLAYSYDRIARKKYEEITSGQLVTQKTYCYALRTALAYRWITTRRQVPPMDVASLVDGQDIRQDVIKALSTMIEDKSRSSESSACERHFVLDAFLEDTLAQKAPSTRQKPIPPDIAEKANALFRTMIKTPS